MSDGASAGVGRGPDDDPDHGPDDGSPGQGAATDTATPAFEVIDVLGLCTLERRSPTLDGSVPMRVAQACLPLLAGNAFGLQIVVRRRLEIGRKLGRLHATAIEGGDELERLHRGAVPMLQPGGLLPAGSAWPARLAGGVVTAPRLPSPGGATLSLFTGLLVRPRPGLRLRLSGTRNRRSLAYDVAEAIIDDAAGFTPLVLSITPRPGSATAFAITGEVATLAALPARVELGALTLEEAPEVAAAHLAFYDRAYFDTKRRGEVARKYRRERPLDQAPAAAGDGAVRLDRIEAGPLTVRAAGPTATLGPLGPGDGGGRPERVAPDRLLVSNAVPLSVSFDGQHVSVVPEAAALDRFAKEVTRRWQATLAAHPAAHPGALLYLTKYVTPHPPGEPHFFVKPAALFRTAPGVSLLLEGGGGDGFEVLRGVIESDRFHAAPAVFQITRPGARFTVEAGAPLMELMPVPRDLLAPRFEARRFGPLAGLAVAEVAGP